MKIATYFLTIIAAVSGLALSGCTRPGPGNSNSNSNLSGNPTPTPEPRAVTLLIDKTGSSSTDDLPRFASLFNEALKNSAQGWHVDIVNIGAKGDGPWNSESVRFTLEAEPTRKFDSESEKKLAHNECWGRLKCIEQKMNIAEDAANRKYDEEKDKFLKRREKFFLDITNEITLAPIKGPPCSDVQEMADRAARTKGDVIWITDADHNCKTVFSGLEYKNRVMVALSSLKNEVPGAFAKRLADLSQKLGTAKVITVATLDSSSLSEFLFSSIRPESSLAKGGNR